MAYTTEHLEIKILEIIAEPLSTETVESHDQTNFYTFLETDRSSSTPQIFQRWCEKVNHYRTNPYWTSLPPNCPERLRHENLLKIVGQVLCDDERRFLYDIRLAVREGVQVDWASVRLTPVQSAYLRSVVTQDLLRLQRRFNKATAEFNEATARFQNHCLVLSSVV